MGDQVGCATDVHQRVGIRGLGDVGAAAGAIQHRTGLVADRGSSRAVGGLAGVGVGEQVGEGQGEGLAAAVGVVHLGGRGGVGNGAIGIGQARDVGGGELDRFHAGGCIEQMLADLLQCYRCQAGGGGQGLDLVEAIDGRRGGELRGIGADIDTDVGRIGSGGGLDQLRHGQGFLVGLVDHAGQVLGSHHQLAAVAAEGGAVHLDAAQGDVADLEGHRVGCRIAEFAVGAGSAGQAAARRIADTLDIRVGKDAGGRSGCCRGRVAARTAQAPAKHQGRCYG